ncbi:hypothetical protein [Cellulomonas sp. KRMCY2]|uniref:hypothetical protein n=1 Tax=Cellulomonas sp. KRMCY2 TaxID=1304865 RepID=UPI00045E6354|nr:hypothetical protein [Cellulomonas sp. KRMCY2]
MSMDFGQALRDITAGAADATRPVDVDRARSKVRRRRTQAVVFRSAGGLAALGAVVTAVALVGGHAPADVSPVAPVVTATPAPTGSSTSDGTLCGTVYALDETDAPDIEVQGAVVVGTLDPETAGFEWGNNVGSTLLVNVVTTSDVPGGEFDGGDRSGVTTMLVGPDGTVAFWTDPANQLQVEATDGSGGISPDGLFDAVDCRTGRPLTGTYRAYATTTTDGTDGGETLELAPVSFEPGSGQMAGQWPDLVPACGRPAPADLLAGDVDADFDVTLDPGIDLDDVERGLHVDVTVTATGPGRLTGLVPQTLHAMLVDRDGMVVSRLYDPTREEFDSGATFDVGQGESFSAEVYQWFASCPDADRYGNVRGGTYDLYVYAVILASAGPDLSPAPRVAIGGPFPITLP